MRIIIPMVLVCLVLPIALFSEGGSINNIQVSQRTDGSGNVDIYYNLAGPGSSYFISMEVSFNNGNTFAAVSSTFLTGTSGITPGTNRYLIWNGKGSNNNTYSVQTKVKLIASTSGPCGQPFTDSRDGKTYNTVQIGTQCWMAQNLNIGTRINGSGNQTNNGIIEKYCYSNLESNCTIYGGLYQWNEMMQYVTTPGVKGICPTGWHIPTDAEWTTLTTYVNNQSSYLCNSTSGNIAKAMAATTLWNSSGNTCAIGNNLSLNNATGFTAVPAGDRYDNAFYGIGLYGGWWSSSEGSTSDAWYWGVGYGHSTMNREGGPKGPGFSVRCLRDL